MDSERGTIAVPKIAPKKDLSDANFPTDDEGRVYHLAVKKGEVANRVLSVGEARRAGLLAGLLDDPSTVYSITSTRGFVIHTGRYHGVPISIIATGMGTPNMDFVVRETRAIVDGPMVMARFGTCGTPQRSIPVGTVSVATSHVNVFRNYDAFLASPSHENNKALSYYQVSKPIPSDPTLTKAIIAGLAEAGLKHCEGMNLSADSFYCSQGRIGSHFDDRNETLVDELMELHPELTSFEMESYHLIHLAQSSKGSIRASAAAIVLAQRKSNEFLDHQTKAKMEVAGGAVVLKALAEYKLDESQIMDGPECVWKRTT